MTPTPEERARRLADELLDRVMAPILTHAARSLIASAIRQAEAEAYERAAQMVDDALNGETRAACARRIRALATKDRIA
jgi:Mg-chelatase subunit ChlI